MIDLHIHTVYSDGTDTPEQLYENLDKTGIKIFSVTDHDNIEFYSNQPCESDGQRILITGIEFTCKTEKGKCHILGYGFDRTNSDFRQIIEKGQKLRRTKLERRIEYLEKKCGITFKTADKEHLFSLRSAGKPHIAKCIIKMGLAESISEAIGKYMKEMPGGNDKLDAKEAITAIKSAGGIAVWAHPLGGEGERHLSEEEFFAQFELLKSFGIQGLECFYSRYDRRESQFLCKQADENNLCKSAGSDYHGSVKNIEIGTLGCEKYDIDLEDVSVLKAIKKDV